MFHETEIDILDAHFHNAYNEEALSEIALYAILIIDGTVEYMFTH